MLKPESFELDERDHRHMYCTRVLEGDLPLVPMAPVLWGGAIVKVEGSSSGEGLQVVVDDAAEFVEGVADELDESVLKNIVMEMARDVACEVCLKQGASDVWEFQRRGLT